MVKKRRHDYGRVGVPVFFYSWEEWKECGLWLKGEKTAGSYNQERRAIVLLQDYVNAKKDEVHGRHFLQYSDDRYKLSVQHKYVHVLQHLVAYNQGLDMDSYLPLGIGAPCSPYVRKNYKGKEHTWLLEDEAIYLEDNLPMLKEVDKEVCSRPEVQVAPNTYMKGCWDK